MLKQSHEEEVGREGSWRTEEGVQLKKAQMDKSATG